MASLLHVILCTALQQLTRFHSIAAVEELLFNVITHAGCIATGMVRAFSRICLSAL